MFRVLFSILIFSFFSAKSQFERFINYNVKDGLPSSETYGIQQDSRGFIWILGDAGISRFDGYQFKNYNTDNGLADNTNFGMFEDNKRRMWFRSLSGKLSYFYNDSFYTIPCNDSLTTLFKKIISNSFYVDSGDTIWIGTVSNFYVKIAPGWKKNNLQKIDVAHGKYINHIAAKQFIIGGDNFRNIDIHFHDRNKGSAYSIKTGIINENNSDFRFFSTRLPNGNFVSSVGTFLFLTKSSEIIARAECPTQIISIVQDNNNTLLVTTYNGVYVFSSSDLKFIKTLPFLDNKIVTGACIDNENEAWFTTEGHGLYCVPHRNFRYYTTSTGLSDSKISAARVVDSVIYTGHLNGSISLLKSDTVINVQPEIKFKSTQMMRVTGIASCDDRIIVTKVIGAVQIKGEKFHSIVSLQQTPFKTIIRSRANDFVFISYSHLLRLDPETYTATQIIKTPARTDNIYESSDHTFWISGVDGIYTVKDSILTYLGSKNKLLTYRASQFCEDNNGVIWIATRGGGLLRYSQGQVIQYKEEHGLAGNICRSLYYENEKIWIGTNKGLSCLSLADQKQQFSNYYANTGLLTNEVNAILKFNDQLLLVHNNGLTVFPKNNIYSSTVAPPVYIDQIHINGKQFKSNGVAYLQHDQNHIAINFTGISFKDGGDVKYKYKLQGLDTNWIFTNYNTANYQGLQPGNYQFSVYAMNYAGIWSAKPAVFSFVIVPAWYQTWLFRISVGILFIVLSLLILKKYYSLVRKREEEKFILNQRVAQTELQALRAQMNPHFVFNAINSVQYFITHNDPQSSQKYLSKFAKLIRYVIENSKPASIPLQTEIDALTLYLELEALRFNNKFRHEIVVDKRINPLSIQIPSMIIQPYVENAIWHGIMHKFGEGRIEIRFTIEETELRCTITDNGIGRAESARIKSGNPMRLHKSLGMNITKERLEIINQMNNTQLKLVISDILNEKNEVEGTIVKLNIPLN